MNILSPESTNELREICHAGNPFRIIGSGSASGWLPKWEGLHISTKRFDQVLEFRPDDLIIRAQAGTSIEEIQAVAAKSGLTLPIPPPEYGWLGYAGKTIGGFMALGLPHFWQNSTGCARDWIIAARTQSPTSDELEFGAQVVKSVAGFDLHRSLVGSRGGLLVLTEVTLRLFPIKLLPTPPTTITTNPCWINRGLPSQFDSKRSHHAVDPSKQLIWNDQPLPGYNSIGPCGAMLPKPTSAIREIQSRLKKLCDPNGVLIEGWTT